MATSQLPAIFLSHSRAGEAECFVWSLYRELLHVNLNPFFHQATKGSPFPSRILDACHACKLAVVVLSHDYIESMWSMLELQHLVSHNPSAPLNLYPVFYKLSPLDLCKQQNLARWKIAWESRAPVWHAQNRDQHMAPSSTSTSLALDFASWPKALEMLRYQNGQILPHCNKDEHAFIQAIVSDICNRFPPPVSFLTGYHFKGAEHIQQKIHELFQQQQQRDGEIDNPRRMPISVGLYGIGGSGKTTVCKYMLSFYDKEYPGSCCFLQFPSREEDESLLLVQSMKDILSSHGNLAKETLDIIKSVEQAMPHFQELMERYKVFLTLDNVWDWALQIAQQIVTMNFMSGSRLLVTARSELLLETLSRAMGRQSTIKIVHVPSISEEEAMEVLMAYSLTSRRVSDAENLRGLARSCFFGEQCHPLLLNAVGAKLRHLGEHTHSTQDWTQLISRLQTDKIYSDKEIEVMVINVLKTSYDALHTDLQKTFLKLGTCSPKAGRRSHYYDLLSSLSEWLSMISENGSFTIEDIRDQLIELEYHGLIQIYKGEVVIHSLQKMLIANIVRENNGAPGCFFFSGDVATLSASDWRRCRYIHGFVEEGTNLRALSPHERRWFPFGRRAMSPNCPDIEVFHLEEFHMKATDCSRSLLNLRRLHGGLRRLSVKHMESLRYLVLKCVGSLKVIGGWDGAPNLVSVKLIECTGLQKIESMSCISTRLESLVIRGCGSLRGHFAMEYVPLKLKELEVSGCRNYWVDEGMLSACISLERCILKDTRIVKFKDIKSSNIRVLELSAVRRLQSMEGSVWGLLQPWRNFLWKGAGIWRTSLI